MGNGGDDTLIGGQGYDNLNGGAGNDLLDGGIDNDAIAGSIGNDTLIGGTGNDILAGEAGDDVYQYQRGDGFDTLTDTSGNDLLLLGAGILPADVSLLRDGFDLFLVLNNSEISIKLQNDQIETIQFQNGTIWNLATIQANTVFGAVNTFTGTAGNDNYIVDNNSDVINEAVDQGVDSITSSVTYYLGANVENLTLTGFLNLNASGNALGNVITGNSGNNLIDGGGYYSGYSPYDGGDILNGGAGDDVYYATSGDVVTELVGGGNDTIYTSSSGYVMQDNVENLIMVGYYQFSMTAYGNSLNNYIQARGNYYDQVIDGGAGADTMTGGYATTFYVDNIGDVVGGTGNYKVYSSVDFTLAAHWDGVYFNNIIETLTLTGSNAIKATGNDGKNALDGRQNAAVNILEGGAGDDTYYAGANDIIIEQVDGGNDTLSVYADWGLYKVGNNIENLIVSTTNTNGVNLEGSDGNNRLDGNNGVNDIKGMGGNDTIYGGTNWGDTLDGGDGNDSIYGNGWLYGGAGDDSIGSAIGATFTGGTGNDIMGGNAVDTFIYARGDGSDTIRDYTDVFNQTSDFRDRISFGAGIAESDILLSRSGDNLIISIAGTSDTITIEQHFVPDVGTLSRAIELLQFENGATWDVAEILIRASSNNSPISENTDYVIGTSNNDLIKSLGGNDFVIAGDGDDTIEGGAGDDTLLGKSGIDVLVGGLGNDTLQGGFGGDTYKFGRGAGIDLIIDAQNNLEIDSILLDADIDPSQIIVRRSSTNYSDPNFNDLTLSIVGDSAQITIQNFYYWLQGKQVVFANGTVWDAATLQSLAVSYFGTSADDVVNGIENSSDKLFGLEGNDTLNGLSGSDTLDGGLGADAMFGATEDDTYVVDNVGDTVTENAGEGYDTVESSITYTLGLNLESLVLTSNLAINGTGNTLDNYIQGNTANNVLDGGTGADGMAGGLGDDVYLVDNINDGIYESAGEGVDLVQSKVTYTLSTDIENLTLTGTALINGTGNTLDNVLIGNSANNRLTGDLGNDTLDGGLGNDTMVGGAGNDVYFVNVATDVVTELANEGNDTVNSAVTYTIASLANIENITLTGNTAINATGNAVANVIIGNSGTNTLTGGDGNDTIEGGLGADTLIGGLGNDTYNYFIGQGNDQIDNTATDNATATDTLYLRDATPANVALSRVASDLVVTVNATATITVKNYFAAGDSKIDQIIFSDATVWNQADIQTRVPSVPTTGDDNLTGTAGNDIIDALAGNDTVSGGDGNDQLLGNTGNDSLIGGNGNDTLNGGSGTDTMVGGTGDDVYTVDATTDVVTENLNEGTDLVNVAIATASGTYTLGANVENGTLTNTVAFTLTGNALDNVLTGNAAVNTLNGGDGNDTLNGLAGNDTMVGGLGNDTYTIDVTTDVITEAASAGTDLVNVAVTTAGGTYTVATNVENATLTNTVAYNLTGNASNNVLTGNAAANALNGGTGNDTMVGGVGNDTYTIDVLTDIITENLNEGTDLVNVAVATAGGTYTLAANVENATLTNTVAYSLTGNALDNVLTGNAAANTLNGGAGNDTLSGLAGNDTMIGGLGNDTYTIDVTTDVITENLNEGTDLVNVAVATASGTYTLAANVENATLTNTVAYSLTGNALDNILTGNAAANTLTGNDGNDTLNGLAGNDTMVGGLGNDIYTIDVTTDVVTEAASAGTDTVNVVIATASGTYTIATNVENAILTNTVAYNLTGNALANFLRGNAANNTLTDTAGGNDLLQGLAGTDTLNDTVGNNLFDGGAGNDAITGGTGREIFIGGLGNDTITTGTGFDVISFNKGDGADIINASTGADNTLSLGGNFAYSDLSLTKTANDLILKMGATDQITLKDWYLTSPTNKSVINLQVVAEAIQGFTLGGADALRNNNIENFNFTNLVAAFDAAGATANWQLTDAILTTHLLAGSDTAAIGGDLAYQYGKNSNLTGMGSLNAQSVIAAASFGQTAQTLNNPNVWQAELVKLG